MIDLTTYSLYGDQANTSAIPASMLNTNADGSTDWNAVLTAGIRGAAQGAIAASVGDKYASGQLVPPANTVRGAQTRNLLIIAAIAYFVMAN